MNFLLYLEKRELSPFLKNRGQAPLSRGDKKVDLAPIFWHLFYKARIPINPLGQQAKQTGDHTLFLYAIIDDCKTAEMVR
jgi:hypothetical protein